MFICFVLTFSELLNTRPLFPILYSFFPPTLFGFLVLTYRGLLLQLILMTSLSR